jgi:solute carrier family 45 protein 1/2/4
MTIRNIDDDAADFRFDVRAIKRGDATITVAEEYQIEDPEGFPRRPRIRIRSQLATEVPAEEESLDNSRADNYDSQEEFESKASMASWSGQPAIKGSTEQMRMALLTFSLVGLQFVPISWRTDWTTWLMGNTGSLGALR